MKKPQQMLLYHIFDAQTCRETERFTPRERIELFPCIFLTLFILN